MKAWLRAMALLFVGVGGVGATGCGGGGSHSNQADTGTSSAINPSAALDSGTPTSATQDSGGTTTTTTQEGGTGGTDGTTMGGTDSGPANEDAPVSTGGANSVPLIVNAGPAGADSVDVPFISVQVCVPGTSNCQTIDYVSVDTGSTGFRVISSTLGGLSLPQESVNGAPLAECYTYADGYVWGGVRLADIKIGGETAKSVPIHVLGDPGFPNVPSDCASTGQSEDTVADFGSNAIIGVGQIVVDCGEACVSTAQPTMYYTCPSGNCTAAAVPMAQQVPDPVSLFATDNNGVVLDFPSVPAGGAATLTGSLIFGVGTASNNAVGSADALTVDEYGNLTTMFNGATLSTSFIDSGSNSYAFNDSSIPACSDMNYYFCPSASVSLMAENVGLNGTTTMVSLSVANADTLFNSAGDFAAFDNLAGPGLDGMTFDWGFPFFIGRTVFVGFGEGTGSMPNGYFAY